MKFDSSFIEKVRDANNIVDIIAQFSQLKASSPGQHLGLCPYPDHNEKTPSFSVSESKQVYYCFGCKKSGNIFTFLQDIKGLSFPEAIEYLANRASIELPKVAVSPEQERHFQQQKEEKAVLKKINNFANKYFVNSLKSLGSDSSVKKYLATRGFTPEIIETFQIGYAPGEWEGLCNKLSYNKAPLNSAEKLGLIKTAKPGNKNKTGYFDIMRDRLMFPIASATGDIVGFGGRVLNPEDKPKYLNSPESSLFHKGKTLYGLFETAKFIRTEDFVVVVEGYTDLIALYAAGIKNVVATLGTALTEDHAKIIGRLTRNITVMFDGDQAGQVAAERSLPILLRGGLHPRGLLLPEGSDPDEYLKQQGVEKLRELIRTSPELFVMVMDKVFKGYRGGATEKVTVVDKLAPYLAAASDKRLADLYIAELQDRLGVDKGWILSALRGKSSESRSHAPTPETVQKPEQKSNNYSNLEKIKIVNPPKAELYLLNLALKNSNNLERVKSTGVLEQFSHEKLVDLFLIADQKYIQNPSEFDKLTASLVERVEPAHLLNLQFETELKNLKADEEVKLVDDCIKEVKIEALGRRHKELLRSLASQGLAEQEKILEEIRDLQKTKMDVLKEFN